jgi:hypothetical protein
MEQMRFHHHRFHELVYLITICTILGWFYINLIKFALWIRPTNVIAAMEHTVRILLCLCILYALVFGTLGVPFVVRLIG